MAAAAAARAKKITVQYFSTEFLIGNKDTRILGPGLASISSFESAKFLENPYPFEKAKPTGRRSSLESAALTAMKGHTRRGSGSSMLTTLPLIRIDATNVFIVRNSGLNVLNNYFSGIDPANLPLILYFPNTDTPETTPTKGWPIITISGFDTTI